jgi:hypothetical protein
VDPRKVTFDIRVKADDLSGAEDVPKWVHVATSGEYKGYWGGERPFSFTKEIFDQIVTNFHNHPEFLAGPDGLGSKDVVPWDFHHASEADPTEGTIAAKGAPSQGWTRDLEVRTSADGVSQLWAYTLFLEPARTYIKNNQYRWASVCVIFDDVDPVSGEDVGARITSIALTNQPFIEGMDQLAASKGGKLVEARYFYAEPAGSAEEAMESLRELLAMPTTSAAADVVSELNKLAEWVTSGTTPLGVDLEYIFSGLRKIMNLPALRTELEVLAEMQTMISRLLAEQAAQSGQTSMPPFLPEDTMEVDQMDLLQVLSKELGVRVKDDYVISAVKELVELRAGVKDALGAEKTSNTAILEAAASAVEHKAKLDALVKALLADDVDTAVVRAAELIGHEETLTEMKPKLEKLEDEATKREEKQAEADVDEVLSTKKLPDHLKTALLMFRKNDPKTFAEKYPRVTPDKALLTQDIATSKGADKSVADGKTIPIGGGGEVIDLANYKGVNKTHRAIDYLRATRKDMADKTWESQCEMAYDLMRKPNVVDSISDKQVS